MNDLCLSDLASIVGGRLRLGAMPPLGGSLEPVGRIVTDSQQLKPGDVYWGLDAPGRHGADFAEQAFSRGAMGVVVAGRHVEPWAGKFTIQVQDANGALWQLARWARQRFAGKVIAVAGSAGKTTTSGMIDTVLRQRLTGSVRASTSDQHAGVMLSLLDLDRRDQYAVIELDGQRPGEIESLAHLCCPHIGVITCLQPALRGQPETAESVGLGPDISCENPASTTTSKVPAPPSGQSQPSRMWRIARSQLELLSALPARAWAVLNGDEPQLRRTTCPLPENVIWVGRGGHCDVVAKDVCSRDGQLTFAVDGLPLSVSGWGESDLSWALAAYAVGRIMTIPPTEIAASLRDFQGPPVRCDVPELERSHINRNQFNGAPPIVLDLRESHATLPPGLRQ